jgi:hypothetical protein
MQLHFTRIPYAVTLPDGELADENYIGHAPLVCEFCGVQMVQEIEADDTLHYRHVLTGHNAFARASSCKYRHSPAGGQQPYHALKPLITQPPFRNGLNTHFDNEQQYATGAASCASTGITATNNVLAAMTGPAHWKPDVPTGSESTIPQLHSCLAALSLWALLRAVKKENQK